MSVWSFQVRIEMMRLEGRACLTFSMGAFPHPCLLISGIWPLRYTGLMSGTWFISSHRQTEPEVVCLAISLHRWTSLALMLFASDSPLYVTEMDTFPYCTFPAFISGCGGQGHAHAHTGEFEQTARNPGNANLTFGML